MEGCVDAKCSDERVGGADGGDCVLHNAQCVLICGEGDVELGGALTVQMWRCKREEVRGWRDKGGGRGREMWVGGCCCVCQVCCGSLGWGVVIRDVVVEEMRSVERW